MFKSLLNRTSCNYRPNMIQNNQTEISNPAKFPKQNTQQPPFLQGFL